ncbi:MAG: low-density lipoprotein receptor-related protein 2-like [Polyangiaceae bacterium]|nr:low-density lipoprotein receptor-related protein 2-like [Polyangiaceae bacterium]
MRQVEVPSAFDIPGPGTAVFDLAGQAFDPEPADAARLLLELGRDNRALSAPNTPRCVLKRAGSAWCTDYLSADDNDPLRARVDLGERVLQVGTGDLFMCALTNEDAVWCEGLNLVGQLGRGMTSTFEDGRNVPGFEGARRLSVAQHSACSLRADGSVWCWGAYRQQTPTAVATQVSACDGQQRSVPVLELASPRNSAARYGAAGLARGQAVCECAFGDMPQEGCVEAEDFSPNAACLEALAPNHEAWNCPAERLWREAQCYDASNECRDSGLVPDCRPSLECPLDVTGSRIASYCQRGTCPESGESIDRKQLCDGTVDCVDGSDERNCTPAQGRFDCGEEQTVAVSSLCDGVVDCANEADESRCF